MISDIVYGKLERYGKLHRGVISKESRVAINVVPRNVVNRYLMAKKNSMCASLEVECYTDR